MNYLLIDGYNLIAAAKGGLFAPGQDLEALRLELLERLLSYRQLKPSQICLVFDAAKAPFSDKQRHNFRGIEVVFSPTGQIADQTIIELFKKRGNRWLVISNDLEICQEIEDLGGSAISSDNFLDKLEFALYAAAKGLTEEEEEEPALKAKGNKKKGPARRASKKERKKKKILKKL